MHGGCGGIRSSEWTAVSALWLFRFAGKCCVVLCNSVSVVADGEACRRACVDGGDHEATVANGEHVLMMNH